MKVSSISELTNSSEEFVPESFRANVKKVYEAKEGEGEHGPWRIQPALVTDGTNDIRIVFSGRNAYAPSDIEGTEIYAKAKKTKKGHYSGLKLKIGTWQDKTKKELFIYEYADVSFGDEEKGSAIIDKGGISTEEKPKSTSSTDNQSDSFEEFEAQENATDAVRKNVAQSANMMLVCLDAARYVKQQFEGKHDTEMTPEQFQAIASSLFINADKRGLISSMPKGALEG